MQTRPLLRPGVAALLAGLAGAVCAGSLAQAETAFSGTIRFCIDKANPVFNLDEAVGTAVAAAEHLTPEFIVRDSTDEDHDNDSGAKQEKFLNKLAASCDLIMGFPTETEVQHLPQGMAATRPYIRTGFVTVTNGAPAGNFKNLANHYKVGVVFLTVTETYFTEANVTHEHIYDSNDELLNALNTKEIDAALMWRPWLDRELASHPRQLTQAPLHMPHAAWNIVALYPAGARDEAARKFNAGIERLKTSGKLAQIVSPEAVPGN
jgi:hypothetical protein